MVTLLVVALLLLLLLAPNWWAASVLKRYGSERPDLPGTGGELAKHLARIMRLEGVNVAITEKGDHYDPASRTVRLLREHYEGKSLTAVAVAAHEVGHALQQQARYRPLALRGTLVAMAQRAEKIGGALFWLAPWILATTRSPRISLIAIAAAIGSVSLVALAHLVTLPVEWNASFGRALPLLRAGGYVTPDEEPIIEKILAACALTYVAASLASLLNVWRFLTLLRR